MNKKVRKPLDYKRKEFKEEKKMVHPLAAPKTEKQVLREPLKRPEFKKEYRDDRKVVTPFNHCASSMMHSEAWSEMRKNNSPNTTGNKAGIAHNKKMREAIGTFKMPHSPLNKGHEVKKDSLGKEAAWAKWEKGYLDRTHKFKGTKFEKPITREENIKEMESERGEFKYDPAKGKVILKKTDDAESPLNKEGKKDACYHKVKAAVKVWPSAYASGQLVQCRKRGASNWGVGKKK